MQKFTLKPLLERTTNEEPLLALISLLKRTGELEVPVVDLQGPDGDLAVSFERVGEMWRLRLVSISPERQQVKPKGSSVQARERFMREMETLSGHSER